MLGILIHQKNPNLKRIVRHSASPVFVRFGAGSREQGARDGVRLAAEIRCDVGHSLTPQGWTICCPLPAGYGSTILGALFGLSPAKPRKHLMDRGYGFCRKLQKSGAPGGGRTHNLRLRRPTLYPVELRVRCVIRH